MSAPTMEERKACWGARDEFWQCLDRHADDASKCEKLRRSFESRCPQQWLLEVTEITVIKEGRPVWKGGDTQGLQWHDMTGIRYLLVHKNTLLHAVKYFDKRRDFLKYKKKLETEGYHPPEAAGKS